MSNSNRSMVFDYRALRLLMGIIAFFLPFIVTIISSRPLSSISASYYTEARDVFVGMLFIVCALLWAYNGHTKSQSFTSKIASISAVVIALFPTACDNCQTNTKSIIHYIAAVILFSILAYFCFGPFRKNTKGKKGKKGRRSKIYLICGFIMVGCMAGWIICKLALPDQLMTKLKVTYWVEAVALCSFGCAWFVAGKWFKPLVDEEEALRLFKR